MKDQLYTGKVQTYNSEKGFGFLSSTEGDIFFHISDFPLADGEPKRNEHVKFVIVDNGGGKLRAVRIQRAPDTSNRAKKTKAVNNNQSITSQLLSNLRK